MIAVALALAAAVAALPACSARTRGGGASCDPGCGSASCGFDGCGTACGAHRGGCGTGQICAGAGGAPATCVTEVRPECGAPPFGTAGDLVARIVVDEPAAYTAAGGNQCAPADGSCYFPDLGLSLTRGHAPLAVFFQGWSSSPRDAIVAWLWDFGAGTDADPGPGLTRPLSNVRIVGNTFVVNGAGDAATFIRIHPWTRGATAWGSNHSGIVVQNNVFHAVAGRDAVAVELVGTADGFRSALAVDHNVVHVPAAADGAPFRIGGTRHALASWRTASGQDLHSVTADPRFVGPLATPAYGPGEPSYAQGVADVAAYLDALHLTSQSPLGGGAVLPVDAFFDFDVAPRLGDGAVDAGAFEAR